MRGGSVHGGLQFPRAEDNVSSISTIQTGIRRLVESGLLCAGSAIGCSETEIAQLEREAGVVLPASYRFFLAQAGRRAGQFFQGTDFLYPELLALREYAEDLLVETARHWTLQPQDFVFAMHQGYQFLFFTCDGAADPPVFSFLEGESGPRVVASSYSAWFLGAVEDEISNARECGEIGPGSASAAPPGIEPGTQGP